MAAFFIFLKKKQDELEERFQKTLAGKAILLDKTALYIAKESDGRSHFRGMGYLVLTTDELYFERQLDGKIIRIPVNAIVRADKTRRLGGQSPGKLMLKVGFKTVHGNDDAIAWKVKNMEEWIKQINLIAKVSM